MRQKPHYRIVLLALSLLNLAGCGGQATDEPEHFVFMAGYKPQANLPFVGVYVAHDKGFFVEENLDVEIQHSAGGGEHLQLLVAGKVDVTTQDAAVLLKRRADPRLPLVSIALIGQQGQQAYVALAETGLETLEDWRGRRIGFKGTPPPDLLALLDAAGLTEEDIKLINVGFDLRVLVEGRVDVYPVFRSNEPYVLESWGYELRVWEAADYDIPTLGLAYVATEAGIKDDPDRLARFTRAALRGIAYAEKHPEEALEITLTYTGPEADAAHMRYMLETEIASAHSLTTEGRGLGWQTSEQWQALLDSLLMYGAMSEPVDVENAFTNHFLESKP